MPTRQRLVLTATTTAAALVATGLIAGCASSANHIGDQSTAASSTPAHGPLTDREFKAAVAIARAEADKAAISIARATATIGAGTETHPNAGPPCTSGKLLHIKLIGAFNIAHGGLVQSALVHSGAPNGSYEPVTTVLITADPDSGKSCLISVQTGTRKPEPGSTVLFTDWHRP